MATANIAAWTHYTSSGYSEARQIAVRQTNGAIASGRWSSPKYLELNPDVAAAGLDALPHYQSSGKSENRDIGVYVVA